MRARQVGAKAQLVVRSGVADHPQEVVTALGVSRGLPPEDVAARVGRERIEVVVQADVAVGVAPRTTTAVDVQLVPDADVVADRAGKVNSQGTEDVAVRRARCRLRQGRIACRRSLLEQDAATMEAQRAPERQHEPLTV